MRNPTASDLGIMQGFPPPPATRPGLADWDLAPWNRWSFQHVREMVPTVEVRRDGPVLDLPRAALDLSGVGFTSVDGASSTVAQMLEDTWTDGFIVLRRGAVLFERYMNGMRPHTQHLSQSVAKSVVGALAGVLAGEGLIDEALPVTTWVPELAATGYAGATLGQVLDMQSGVRFDEDYTSPTSDIARLDIACGWKPLPADGSIPTIRDVILSLPAERPHGELFSYRSIETDVIAWVLERAAGMSLAELVSDRIWSRIGAERDACFTVDRAGTALADGGFNATLRDYARFGEMIRCEGRVCGEQVVPAAWIAGMRQGDSSKFGEPYTLVSPNGAYCRQWWVRDVARGDLMARGVFGQMIYVDPEAELTVVKLSTWPTFLSPRYVMDTLAAIDAIKATI